jgi:hypothetical protein
MMSCSVLLHFWSCCQLFSGGLHYLAPTKPIGLEPLNTATVDERGLILPALLALGPAPPPPAAHSKILVTRPTATVLPPSLSATLPSER